ncbi:hypothetical protein CRUP_019112 [Coryphaenoides rupestris]|nr:hypothetical protein CRUP_019112 [Coryphaenoides rupestris]
MASSRSSSVNCWLAMSSSRRLPLHFSGSPSSSCGVTLEQPRRSSTRSCGEPNSKSHRSRLLMKEAAVAMHSSSSRGKPCAASAPGPFRAALGTGVTFSMRNVWEGRSQPEGRRRTEEYCTLMLSSEVLCAARLWKAFSVMPVQ